MNSAELIKRLQREGWKRVGGKGDHFKFKHPEKPGHIALPIRTKLKWLDSSGHTSSSKVEVKQEECIPINTKKRANYHAAEFKAQAVKLALESAQPFSRTAKERGFTKRLL